MLRRGMRRCARCGQQAQPRHPSLCGPARHTGGSQPWLPPVAWWAQYERPAYGTPVAGALLVAPPEVDVAPLEAGIAALRADADPSALPLDPRRQPKRSFMTFERARRLATFWGSGFVDAGAAGHINADSALGKWSYGRSLLDRFGEPRAGQSRAATAVRRSRSSLCGRLPALEQHPYSRNYSTVTDLARLRG